MQEKLFEVKSRPQGKIIDIKCEKSQEIGNFELFSAFSELFRELVMSNMQNYNLSRVHGKLLKQPRL